MIYVRILFLWLISFAALAQTVDQYKTTTAAGSVNAYTIPNSDFSAYRTNEKWLIDFTGVTTNSGACTLNRFGLGAKSIKMPDGTDPTAGVLTGRVQLSYNGTVFYIVGGAGSGGSSLTIGSFNNTSTANAADVTSNVLTIHAADATNPGAVSTTAQSFTGAKTFTSDLIANANFQLAQNSSGISGSNADLNTHPSTNIRLTNGSLVSLASISTSGINTGHQLWLHNDTGNPITIINNGTPPGGSAKITTTFSANITLQDQNSIILEYDATDSAWRLIGNPGFANASYPGFLSSTDWTTFNNKQASLVSGTNIKTVNSSSLLGSGNLAVGDALVANPLSQFASTTSAQLRGVLSDESGTAEALFGGATPSALNLINATGLPPTTGISGWPANSAGTLTNNGSGTLSWSSSLTNPMTTAGDIIVGGTSGAAGRLGIGANNSYPKSNGSALAYSDFPQDARGSFMYIPSSATVNFIGDSFTSADVFSPIVVNSFNLSENNYGTAGKGWYHGITTQIYTHIAAGNTNPVFALLGLNDIKRMASNVTANSKTLEKLKCGVRVAAAITWLKSAVAANDAGISTTGSWSTTSGANYYASAQLSGLARTTTTNGATLTYTGTILSGEAYVIGALATDESATTGGDFTYAVDGGTAVTYTGKNKTDGISDGANDNSLMPNAIFITGLAAGSHTIVITTTSTATVRIDYIGIINHPRYCAPLLINSIPYNTATGYATSPSTGGSDATIDQGTQALLDAKNEFLSTYPIFFNEIKDIYNILTGVSGDGIHPSTTGYGQIADAEIRMIKKSNGETPFLNPTTIRTNDGTSTGYIFTGSNAYQLSYNRNSSGTIINSGLPGMYTAMNLASGDANFTWAGGATNNATSGVLMKLDKNGLVTLGASSGGLALTGGNSNYLTLGDRVFHSANGTTIGDISINRTPGGTFISSSQTALIFRGTVASGSSQWDWYTHVTNNTTPVNRMRLNGSGDLTVTNSLAVGGAVATVANSTFQVSGSVAFGYVAKTANYTLTASDWIVNCTANSFTITLPTAVNITGRSYIIKNTGSGTITLATTSSQTIDGTTPGTLAAGPTVIRLISDGANWITF